MNKQIFLSFMYIFSRYAFFAQYYLDGIKAVFVLRVFLYFVLYAYWKKTASNTIYIELHLKNVNTFLRTLSN